MNKRQRKKRHVEEFQEVLDICLFHLSEALPPEAQQRLLEDISSAWDLEHCRLAAHPGISFVSLRYTKSQFTADRGTRLKSWLEGRDEVVGLSRHIVDAHTYMEIADYIEFSRELVTFSATPPSLASAPLLDSDPSRNSATQSPVSDQHDQEFETTSRDGVWDATGDDTPWISPEDALAHGANPEEQEAVDLAQVRPYGDVVEADEVPSTDLLSQEAIELPVELSLELP